MSWLRNSGCRKLGKNIETATVIRVLVEPGQRIEKEQTVMELETEKATLEVPSAVAGQVKEIMVKAGQTIEVGAVILTVEQDSGGESGPAVREVPAGETPAQAPAPRNRPRGYPPGEGARTPRDPGKPSRRKPKKKSNRRPRPPPRLLLKPIPNLKSQISNPPPPRPLNPRKP